MSKVLREFSADYFSLSGLGRIEPVVGHGKLHESSAMREGVVRAYPEPYPPVLNINSIAQLTGSPHEDSQLLLRMAWKLREEMGRENLDPLILEAFGRVSSINE